MAIIKTLKDKLGNIVYPQTLVTGVYDSSGKTLDTLMDKKMGVVSSATAGNLPTLTADGQLVDSGKKIDEVGGGTEDFIIMITSESGNSFTCDKTSAEINAAYAAGKKLVASTSFNSITIDFPLTYAKAVPDSDTLAYTFSILNKYGGSSSIILSSLYITTYSSGVDIATDSDYMIGSGCTGLSSNLKNQFRSNIGAGTSDFSGSYNDLTDKPTLIPTSRTINGKALSSNITLTAADVGALPATTTVPTIHSGTTDPSATLGSDGDLYIKYAE